MDMLSQGGHASLPPLPLVPYALSMSTTIIYRALRDTQRDLNAAYKDLTTCHETLDALSQTWTTVRGTAKLAKRILRMLSPSRSSKPQKGSQNKRNSALPDIRTLATVGTLPPTDEWNNEGISQEPSPNSTVAIPAQPKEGLHQKIFQMGDEQDPSGQQETSVYWPGMGTPFSQFDRAFGDLFDHTMPNMFRDPMTWDIHGMGSSDDESFYQFQLASPYMHEYFPITINNAQ